MLFVVIFDGRVILERKDKVVMVLGIFYFEIRRDSLV